jgi:hypothetical protein
MARVRLAESPKQTAFESALWHAEKNNSAIKQQQALFNHVSPIQQPAFYPCLTNETTPIQQCNNNTLCSTMFHQ